MTTIVGDWNRKILVSDSQFSDDDVGIKYFDEKIVPIDGGWLGIAGNWSDCEKVINYLNKKTTRKPKLKSDSSFIKLTKDDSNSNSGDSISGSVSDNKDIFEDKNNLPNSCFTIFKKGVENNFRLFLNYVGAKR